MPRPCHVIGITGGISTGKSTFCQRLRDLAGAKRFDADHAARQLVNEDAEVRTLLRREFGPAIFSASGDLNRAALRAIVFADKGKKRALEQILHPRIRRQWATEAEQSRQSGRSADQLHRGRRGDGNHHADRAVGVAAGSLLQKIASGSSGIVAAVCDHRSACLKQAFARRAVQKTKNKPRPNEPS